MARESSPKPKGRASIPFWESLRSVFPDVQCERRFDWLALPIGDTANKIEANVRAALIKHCREAMPTQSNPKKKQCAPELLAVKLARPSRPKLEFDFYVPSLNLAFEFDEKQHFTAERAASLRCYQGKMNTHFNMEEWIGKCNAIRAVDTDPIWRDWYRAYRDAVRDIRAAKNSVTLIRYAYDNIPSHEALVKLTSRSNNVIHQHSAERIFDKVKY
jgi:hypothetical protein